MLTHFESKVCPCAGVKGAIVKLKILAVAKTKKISVSTLSRNSKVYILVQCG